jgi:transposase
MNDREQRGLALAALYRIEPKDGKWIVPSQTGNGTRYEVDPSPTHPTCTCPDHRDRGDKCKHMFEVEFTLTRERAADGLETIERTFTVREKITYKQDWPNYNRAQAQEKRLFLQMLADVCRGIPEPPPARTGRPPIRLADMVFSVVYKVYSTVSPRRFTTDLEDAATNGFIAKAPHFNSVIRQMDGPGLTPILKRLIVEKSKPLASVGQDFAGDSSGFTTCRFVKWFDHKYGTVREKHGWVKTHIMCGVKTNIAAAVEIKDRNASDPVQLPELIKRTAETFSMREVSLDKVYASYDNYDAIEGVGAMPYIPFKSIHNGRGPGHGSLWAKMYHFIQYNNEEFMRHYHKRSNVETAFSMVKGKFRDHVRAKTETGMVNEVLAKFVCHNICCLIHAAFEFGVESRFWRKDELLDEPNTNGAADEAVAAMAWM